MSVGLSEPPAWRGVHVSALRQAAGGAVQFIHDALSRLRGEAEGEQNADADSQHAARRPVPGAGSGPDLHLVPFLQRIKETFGIPLALVHDMGKAILAAVAKVFPGVPDFICHFHFLRDIGKDFLGAEYDTIRNRLRQHGISAKLRYRAKQLKREIDRKPELIEALETGFENTSLPTDALEFLPVFNVYTLIQWTLRGKSEGHGYGFPFDQPHLVFAQRIRRLHSEVEKLQAIQLRGQWQDNKPYFKLYVDLKNIIKDRTLWKALEAIEEKIIVFEKLLNMVEKAAA